jgi:uncharacterized repeat protein (TIGR03803 family)
MKTLRLGRLAAVSVLLSILPASAQTFRTLFTFDVLDGQGPIQGVVRDDAGNLYGTTYFGGTYTYGVAFKIDKSDSETVLYNFGTNSAFPASSLIRDTAGNLYGSTQSGKIGSVIFRLDPKNKEKILYEFTACYPCLKPDLPDGALLMDSAGNFFGATLGGGVKGKGVLCQFGCGVLFKLDSAGKLHVLYAFKGAKDGALPYAPLLQDAAGNLYGVALNGGDFSCPQQPLSGCGTVFKLAKDGRLTVLHSFTGGKDGAFPSAGLLMDSAGNLYGAAQAGGQSGCGLNGAGCGTLFKISSSGKLRVLYTFTDGTDGAYPNGRLVQDSAGNLYGSTYEGDQLPTFYGVVFKLSKAGRFTVLHTMNGGSDGGFPSPLTRDSTGNLYGTAYSSAGFDPGGTVFEVTP